VYVLYLPMAKTGVVLFVLNNALLTYYFSTFYHFLKKITFYPHRGLTFVCLKSKKLSHYSSEFMFPQKIGNVVHIQSWAHFLKQRSSNIVLFANKRKLLFPFVPNNKKLAISVFCLQQTNANCHFTIGFVFCS
jgi:hypothetical protein